MGGSHEKITWFCKVLPEGRYRQEGDFALAVGSRFGGIRHTDLEWRQISDRRLHVLLCGAGARQGKPRMDFL